MKKKVGILYGGRSGEHEISLLSGAAGLRALDKEKYIPVPIGIDKEGAWFIADGFDVESAKDKDALVEKLAFVIEQGEWKSVSVPFEIDRLPEVVDIVFPAVHGVNGEDGTLQGLMEMLGVPYAG